MDYIIHIRFDHFCSSTLISFSLSSHNWLRRALLTSWHCSLGSIDDLTVTSDKEEPRFSAALYRRMDGSKHTAVIVVAAPWEGFLSATNSSGRRTWAIDDWTEMFAETSSDHSGMYAETSSIFLIPSASTLMKRILLYSLTGIVHTPRTHDKHDTAMISFVWNSNYLSIHSSSIRMAVLSFI